MPTRDVIESFWRDWDQLTSQQQHAFLTAVTKFVHDLRAGTGFRPGPRVKGVQGARGIYELTWAPDGRATFQYGEEQREGDPHVVWRRIGTHDVLKAP
jgi:hypothetical protein